MNKAQHQFWVLHTSQTFEEKPECQVPPGCRSATPDGQCCGQTCKVPVNDVHEFWVPMVGNGTDLGTGPG